MSDALPLFMQDERVAEILLQTGDCVPDGCAAFLVGGAMRNALYYECHGEELPQRDYDVIFLGDGREAFSQCLEDTHGFTYGKLRREHQTTFRKPRVDDPGGIDDYVVLDVHYRTGDVMDVVRERINFTINTFTLSFSDIRDMNWKEQLQYVEGAVGDMQDEQLRINPYKEELHGSDLFACIRFVSLGFHPPSEDEVQALVDAYPQLPVHKFDRNVEKVFDYVGGEERARAILDRLGIEGDVFDIDYLRSVQGGMS